VFLVKGFVKLKIYGINIMERNFYLSFLKFGCKIFSQNYNQLLRFKSKGLYYRYKSAGETRIYNETLKNKRIPVVPLFQNFILP